MKGKLILLVAPSGAGKSTFLNKILSEREEIAESVTYTSREKRPGEVDGEDYHFVSVERFQELIDQNFFIEWAKVHSNFYGSPIEQIHEVWKRGQAVIMDVDIQGADTFKKHFPEALGVFILPPSMEELRRRVMGREGDKSDIDLRMENAAKEMERAKDFDVQLVNDVFESSYEEFEKIIDDFVKKP